MGLEKLKKKVEETKEKFDALQMGISLMKKLDEILPQLLDEQKRTNELLEEILEKLGGGRSGDIRKKE